MQKLPTEELINKASFKKIIEDHFSAGDTGSEESQKRWASIIGITIDHEGMQAVLDDHIVGLYAPAPENNDKLSPVRN